VRDIHEAAKLLGVEIRMVAFGDWFRERALAAAKGVWCATRTLLRWSNGLQGSP